MLDILKSLGETSQQATEFNALEVLQMVDSYYSVRFAWLLTMVVALVGLIGVALPLFVNWQTRKHQERILEAKKKEVETALDEKVEAAEKELSKRTRLLEKRLDSTQAEMWYDKGEANRNAVNIKDAVRFYRSTIRRAAAANNGAFADKAATKLGKMLKDNPKHNDLRLDLVRQHIEEARQAFSEIGSSWANMQLDCAIETVAKAMNMTNKEYLDFTNSLEENEQP